MDLSGLFGGSGGDFGSLGPSLSDIFGGGGVDLGSGGGGVSGVDLGSGVNTGGGIDLGKILGAGGSLGNLLGQMGLFGNKLQGALSGIPPQDLALLTQEIQGQGFENQTAAMRNQIISQMFPQFLSQNAQINPGAVTPFANAAMGFANRGADAIGSATPTLQQALSQISSASPDFSNAENFINSATPTLQKAMQFIQSATPTLQKGQGFLDQIPGLENLAQQNISAMTPDINDLATQLKMFMNLGDPFYQERQRQAFENTSQQYNDYAGQLRQVIGQQGYGAAPTGLASSAEAGLMSQGAQNLSENWLQNLFNSENMSLQAAGMFPAVGQLRGQQAGLQSALPQIPMGAAAGEAGIAGGQMAQGAGATGVGGAQVGQGGAMAGVGGARTAQGGATTNVGGQQIGQGLGFGQMGQVASGAGNLTLGGQQLQASKAQMLNPLAALPQFPRSPTFVQPAAQVQQGKSGSSGGGGILGDIIGGIGSIFGL